jgi:glutathione S-transferase
MELTLHYNVLSSYSQKVLLAFYEKGVPFTPAIVNLFDPAANAEYRKLYPLGKIPLLTGDDLFIPESTIIIEYLEDTFPESGTRLIPADRTEARRVRFKDRVSDLYVNNQVLTIFFDSRQPEAKRNPDAVAKARQVLDISYGYLDASLKESAFVHGDTLSMADLALFPGLFYAQRLHPYADRPALTAWFGRMMQRPSTQRLMGELMPALQKMMGG